MTELTSNRQTNLVQMVSWIGSLRDRTRTLIFQTTRRMTMKPMQFSMLAAFVLISPTISHAQVAGSTPLGVTVTELQAVVKGWSVKRTVLGQAVYNDKDEKVGSVDDIIITPDKAVSYGHHRYWRLPRPGEARCRHTRFSAQVSR